jgi:hypothetical protein
LAGLITTAARLGVVELLSVMAASSDGGWKASF